MVEDDYLMYLTQHNFMSIELTDWEFFDDIEEGYRKFFFSYVKVYFF